MCMYVHYSSVVLPMARAGKAHLSTNLLWKIKVVVLSSNPGRQQQTGRLINQVSPKYNTICSVCWKTKYLHFQVFASCSSVWTFSVRDAPMDVNAKMLLENLILTKKDRFSNTI